MWLLTNASNAKVLTTKNLIALCLSLVWPSSWSWWLLSAMHQLFRSMLMLSNHRPVRRLSRMVEGSLIHPSDHRHCAFVKLHETSWNLIWRRCIRLSDVGSLPIDARWLSTNEFKEPPKLWGQPNPAYKMEPEQSLGPDLTRMTRKMGCFARDVRFFFHMPDEYWWYLENIWTYQ